MKEHDLVLCGMHIYVHLITWELEVLRLQDCDSLSFLSKEEPQGDHFCNLGNALLTTCRGKNKDRTR